MPKKGYKSLTLPQDVYDRLRQDYAKNRDFLRKKGIRNFSGFLMYLAEMEEARRTQK